MPVEETSVLNITCDNPRCPGHNDVDPSSRTGWLFITSEVYGEPTATHVYGNVGCLNSATAPGQPTQIPYQSQSSRAVEAAPVSPEGT